MDQDGVIAGNKYNNINGVGADLSICYTTCLWL